MNTLDVLKQALEALWNSTAKLESQLFRNPVVLPENYKDAVTEGYAAHAALRAAISEQEKCEPLKAAGPEDQAIYDSIAANYNTHPAPVPADQKLVELVRLQHEALDKHSVPYLGHADWYNQAIEAFNKWENGE